MGHKFGFERAKLINFSVGLLVMFFVLSNDVLESIIPR
jgi:hypothetical protein